MKNAADNILSIMPDLLDKLLSNPLMNQIPSLPSEVRKDGQGVYVFYENDEPLYVGRSGKGGLRNRILRHKQKDDKTNSSATLAFKLAKEQASPKSPKWESLYKEQRKRVKRMQIRIVEIDDPPKQAAQAMFEIYAAHVLNTPYNTFETS